MKSTHTAKLRKKMFSYVDQWESSNQTQQAFCASKGINYGVFKYWRRKKKDAAEIPETKSVRTNKPSQSSFIPVTVKASEKPPLVTTTVFELQYPNGVKLQCSSGICKEELRALITVL